MHVGGKLACRLCGRSELQIVLFCIQFSFTLGYIIKCFFFSKKTLRAASLEKLLRHVYSWISSDALFSISPTFFYKLSIIHLILKIFSYSKYILTNFSMNIMVYFRLKRTRIIYIYPIFLRCFTIN